MAKFFGLSIGPFVFGRVTEGQPQRRSRRESLIIWLVTGLVFLTASPLVGALIIIGALLVHIAITTAAHDTEDQP